MRPPSHQCCASGRVRQAHKECAAAAYTGWRLTTVCACSYLTKVEHLDLAFTQVANLAALAQVRATCSAARHTPALLRQPLIAALPLSMDKA